MDALLGPAGYFPSRLPIVAVEVGTWEPTNELALPDRIALDQIVSADVERMATTPFGTSHARAYRGLRTGGHAAFGRSPTALVRSPTSRPGT